jgi:hypothetical protein
MQAVRKFAIFRAGTHRAMNGNVRTYTPAEVRQMAASYSVAKQSAGLTLDHPPDDLPVMGYVSKLTTDKEGRTLYATAAVNDTLMHLVKTGQRTNVSSAFYTPGSAHNPEPGSYYLRHVGFLGKMKPAVQGLGSLDFSQAVIFPVGISVRDFLSISADGMEPAVLAFAAPAGMMVDPSRLEIHRQASALRFRAPGLSYVEAVRRIVAATPGNESLAFAAPAGMGVEPSRMALHMKAVALQVEVPHLSYMQAVRRACAMAQGGGAVEFSAPAGMQVDPDRLALHRRAVALQDRDPSLSYSCAVLRAESPTAHH